MSEARRREIEREREAKLFARALVTEFNRAEQQRLKDQEARERWLALSPEGRRQYEELAEQAAYSRRQRDLAEREQARQSHGGSLDSIQVTLAVTTYRSFLYGAIVLTVLSYIDIYRWLRDDHGDFPKLPMWATLPICLCLYVSRKMEWQLERIYGYFDRPFPTWKAFVLIFLSAPAVALSGLFLLGWMIDHLL